MDSVLYIANVFNAKDAEILGISDGNFSLFQRKIIEHADELNNACIVTDTFDIFIKLLDDMEIQFQTEDAYFNGNVWYIKDKKSFCELFNFKTRDENIYRTWTYILREISNDIDTVEERYSAYSTGKFLRSLLVYFSSFTIAEQIRG